MRLILASTSPRRVELLRAAGFTFEIVATDVDEQVRPGETASAYVRRLAAEKSAAAQLGTAKAAPHGTVVPHVLAAPHVALAPHVPAAPLGTATEVAQGFSPAEVVILGADTVVVIDGQIFGKPRDDDEAASMLRRLSWTRHEVLTGISLRHGASELGRVETTTVHFTPLSDADVEWYVASGEGRDKAGAYAIQGLASRFISRIEGSYSNVVGLPVAAVHELLTSHLASGL
jgi:septum formation protein